MCDREIMESSLPKKVLEFLDLTLIRGKRSLLTPVKSSVCIQYLNCRGDAGNAPPHRELASPHHDLASPHRGLDVHPSRFERWMMKRSRASYHE